MTTPPLLLRALNSSVSLMGRWRSRSPKGSVVVIVVVGDWG